MHIYFLSAATVFLFYTIWSQPKARLPHFDETLRELSLGDINFLHTTDTHGWFLGHINQRQYSADWGDFLSFTTRLRDICQARDLDLLLIDTGDRHDGNGLSDLTTPNGLYSSDVFMQQEYDIVTVGNHELYVPAVSELEYKTVVPHYGDRFISTNVEYLNDKGEYVVFGHDRYRYFTTEVKKYNVFALSFMFDFKGGNERVRVTPIETVVKEDWFLDLLEKHTRKPVDLVLVAGHIPISHSWLELYVLHGVLRTFFPDIPIQYFGGHSHIRDFTLLDDRAFALQSGRYCETVGFMSLSNIKGDNVTIDRKYIDFNLQSFLHHTKRSTIEQFNTDEGLQVSEKLTNYSNLLKLDESFGKVPRSYYITGADYYSNDSNSMLRFIENEVLRELEPKICHEDMDPILPPPSNSRIVLINTGSIRYDLYKGDFSRNSQFIVSPFKNKWKVLQNVPARIATRLQAILNKGPYIMENEIDYTIDLKELLSPYQREINSRISSLKLRYGQTTTDDLGSDGDDTIHRPVPQFAVPNVIQSYEYTDQQQPVDVVFYDFIERYVLWALQKACDGDNLLYYSLVEQLTFYNDCEQEFNVGELLKKYSLKHWR
ncbi:hypothetical protein KL905_001188 [Ogataea polymorpha]|uniref:Calcineurin-like phosphoesterase domain-containing protein n=2 Tax=Ogataea polymorpha TaxID=460523 RepID=A0A9P8PEH3_9ASCO|nr:hypothetical protein KL937_004435 [Ogataea polymorpha]KAG7896781.1 hypothetical protein KL908_000183 [Ogataea polymorpha]KAG7903416.1 hypothetical protein KL935_000948 [Ogataea polymorpha]KAG7913448.1 hypothetical protein KL907_000393 [Ogataea polymorpha]KAG7920256.1 hypothetical protein KL927_000936 [Ogataea polymorpha]